MAEESKTVTIINPHVKLQEVMDHFSWGAHRVLVHMKSEQGELVAMLTQTDVLNYLYQNKEKLGSKISQTVESLGLGKKATDTLSNHVTALEAFRIVSQHLARAMPIAQNGTIIANISCSDLRGIHQDTVKFVIKPVMEYLNFIHEGKVPAPVTCTPSTPLLDVIELLLKNKIHRVWVVHPTYVGVISITDVIHQFAPWHNQ